jgi:pyruvate dehydrogenase E2 component (dihydrolipoamide acetyltransferase)
MEVESVEDGTIGKLLVLEGEEYIKVNAPIAILLFDGDSLPLKLPSKEKKEDEINVQVVSSNKLKEVDLEVNVEFKNEVPSIIKENKSIKKLKRIFSSPLARRIAKLKNIDLTSVLGSGPNGRILKIDIESLSDNNNLKIENSLNINDNFEIVKNTTMRKTIAERLVKSKNEAPHFYLSLDCNIDKLLEIRASINSKSNNDFKISVNDIIIKTVSASLIKVPKANASWENENTKYFKNTDISVAVAINGGLITPIVRDVQSKGLMSISLEMKNLSTKAKEGKLLPEEYVGGSFSISNLGMFGIKEFSAVINPPQGAILAVGAGEQRPVVIDGQISIATIMTVTLSCDHRVVDGAVGAEFLSAFKEYIENPALMLL